MKLKIILAILILLVVLGAGALWYSYSGRYPNTILTGCTEEAKLCTDGSSVGRVPPTCEFAECPSVDENTDIGMTECELVNFTEFCEIQVGEVFGSFNLVSLDYSSFDGIDIVHAGFDGEAIISGRTFLGLGNFCLIPDEQGLLKIPDLAKKDTGQFLFCLHSTEELVQELFESGADKNATIRISDYAINILPHGIPGPSATLVEIMSVD